MKKILLVLLTTMTSSVAMAQTAPNMIGTWLGVGNVAVYGSGLNHPADNKNTLDNVVGKNGIRFRKTEYKFIVDQQEGLMFSGFGVSKTTKTVQLGTLARDLKTGVMVNVDGAHMTFQLDGNIMHVCGTRARQKLTGNIDNAFCYEFTRQ